MSLLFHRRRQAARLAFSVTAGLLALSLAVDPTHADVKSSPRARYAEPSATSDPLRFTPINLNNGSELTLISPSHWSEPAATLIEVIKKVHEDYTDLFDEIPAFSTSIRLMEEEEFFKLTSAPRWTNAMYFRGQIILPISSTKGIDVENLSRSVRHEYTHAVLSAISGGKLPGWIDEGLAQWFEGVESPGLRRALRVWLQTNEPIPLALLQGGFTKLKPEMVPAAYAQSLLATRLLADKYGFDAMAKFFFMLREGIDKESAFVTAYSLSTQEFEAKLDRALKRWAAEDPS